MDSISATAIRSLSIDVANLTSRVAVLAATLEDLKHQAMQIDPAQWVGNEVNDADSTGHPIPLSVVVPAEQAGAIQTLLSSIASVQ